MSTERYAAIHAALRIDPTLIAARALTAYDEATDLVLVAREVTQDGEREFLLSPSAAVAWREMSDAAAHDGIELLILSAYRSVTRQIEIIERKLAAGQSIDTVLGSIAPPGFSEHHTGRAVDIGSPDHPYLDVSFERTAAFSWLTHSAHAFGFRMSYPVGNPSGYQYEPWHWCFHAVVHA